MKKSPVLALLGATVLSLSILLSAGIARAITTETFTGTVVGGAFDGTVGTGSFTFDETLIVGFDQEFISALDGLLVDFTLFGQTFTEADDFFAPLTPELSFFDGEIVFLDFAVSEEIGDVLTAIDEPGVVGFLFVNFVDLGNGFAADVFVDENVAVSEASALALFGVGLLGIGFARRRRSA